MALDVTRTSVQLLRARRVSFVILILFLLSFLDGIDAMKEVMPFLEEKHTKDLEHYDGENGKDNEKRLCGRLETSSSERFNWDVANRACSVRIPHQVAADKKVTIFILDVKAHLFTC